MIPCADFGGRSTVSGSSCETIVSLAFGDGEATTGSCSDASPMHFTGKMRDAETASSPGGTDGLDDFDARYYSSEWGRFISADWSAVPEPVPYANFTNPQTLNLYAIVADNPGTFVDLDGHLLKMTGNNGDFSEDESALRDMAGGFSQYLNFADAPYVNFSPPGTDTLSPEAKQIYDWVRSPNLFVFSVKPLGQNRFQPQVVNLTHRAAMLKLAADAAAFAAIFIPEERPEAVEAEVAAEAAAEEVEAATEAATETVEGSHDGPRSGKRFSRADRAKDAGKPCVYCGRDTTEEPGEPNSRETDHIYPRSRGGNDSPENRAPACRDCNRAKGARTPIEWRRIPTRI